MLAKIPWKPSDRQLRQFGFCCLPGLPLLGWLVLGWTGPTTWTASEIGAFSLFAMGGVVAGLLAWRWPRSLRVPFLTATLVTLPIGLVVGEVLLLAIYACIFTPVALFFRLMGRDVLDRRFDPSVASYWTRRTQPAAMEQYFRQS